MPIQINDPNLSGLTALAGRSGNLNLPVPGALGLQAVQTATAQSAARAQAAAEQQRIIQQWSQQKLLRDQMAQQGVLAQQENATAQQRLAQEAAQYAGTSDYRERALAQTGELGQANVDIEKQKLAQQQQQQMMVKLADMSKQELKERGAYASYGMMAMQNAKTPEEANQIRASMVPEALSKGYIQKEQADAMMKMPLSQYKALLGQSIIATGVANDFKDTLAATAPKGPVPGTTTIYDPQTGKPIYTSTVSKPETNKLQADLVGAKDSLREVDNIYKNVDDKFFGAAALGQGVTYLRELGESIPGVGKYIAPSQESKDTYTKYSNLQAATNGLAMDVIKEKSGVQYSDQQLAFMMKILPEFGPTVTKSNFEGKVQNLRRYLNEVISSRNDLLKNNFQLGTPEYEQAMSQKIDDIQSNFFNKEKSPADILRQGLSDQGFSKEAIEAEIQRRKL